MKSFENHQTPYIDNSRDDMEKIHDLAIDAEEVVVDFFNGFSGLSARLSTEYEDSGNRQIGSGKQIDAVVYMDDEAMMGVQITIATNKLVREEKMRQLAEKPLVRIPEMKLQDVSMPKVLVSLSKEDIKSFLEDKDYSKHEGLSKKILNDTVLSLKFDLTQTKNPKEKLKILKIMSVIDGTAN